MTNHESAFDWFAELGDRIDECGTASFGTTELRSYSFEEKDNGTWYARKTFPDGTSLGLAIGQESNGTVNPCKACAKIMQGQKEIARVDWDEGARRNRDRWVHVHILNRRNHIYFEHWHDARDATKKLLE